MADFFRRNLPHWRIDGACYFVTWRQRAGEVELTRDERTIVASAIKHFDRERYRLFAWVVMNDHVHVIFQPTGSHSVSQLLHSWKSFTANALQRRSSRKGSVWQDESEHVVRDDAELIEKMTYVANNPRKRWPHLADYEWVWFLGKDVQSCTSPAGTPAP